MFNFSSLFSAKTAKAATPKVEAKKQAKQAQPAVEPLTLEEQVESKVALTAEEQTLRQKAKDVQEKTKQFADAAKTEQKRAEALKKADDLLQKSLSEMVETRVSHLQNEQKRKDAQAKAVASSDYADALLDAIDGESLDELLSLMSANGGVSEPTQQSNGLSEDKLTKIREAYKENRQMIADVSTRVDSLGQSVQSAYDKLSEQTNSMIKVENRIKSIETGLAKLIAATEKAPEKEMEKPAESGNAQSKTTVTNSKRVPTVKSPSGPPAVNSPKGPASIGSKTKSEAVDVTSTEVPNTDAIMVDTEDSTPVKTGMKNVEKQEETTSTLSKPLSKEANLKRG